MEGKTMKTKLTLLAMIVCLMMVPVPAFSGDLVASLQKESIDTSAAGEELASDWFSAFKEEMIETGDFEKAMYRAMELGAQPEDILLAYTNSCNSCDHCIYVSPDGGGNYLDETCLNTCCGDTELCPTGCVISFP